MIKKIREMEGIIMRGNERERVMKVKYPPPSKKSNIFGIMWNVCGTDVPWHIFLESCFHDQFRCRQ